MATDVTEWLDRLGLGKYAELFALHEIDEETLPHLTNQDLKEMGLPIGPRRKLLTAIGSLRADKEPAASPILDDSGSERRQVTVLFADISGFTRLTSELDAEETHALLGDFFGVADQIVERYGGRIDKHIGDAVMAVFGAPVAHTDDPERALRAALEIHAAITELQPPLTVHLGIASGQVVASKTGSAAHVEYTVTGDSVNLASRLTDMAASGETCVSEAVRRALGDRFVGEDLGPQVIEGLPEPTRVWRLTDITSGPGGNRHTFVGRERELAKFVAALRASQKSKSGEVLILRGEPGIGKTRLLEEINSLAETRGFTWHRCLVLDFGAGKGQSPIHALVRSLLGIEPGSEKAARAEAVDGALAKGWLREASRVHLNNLLDLDQPPDLLQLYAAMDNPTRIRGGQQVVAKLVAARCDETPLLIEIEDIHWAAPDVLDQLAFLSTAIAEIACVLVMTTRIVGDPTNDAWRAQVKKTPITTIDLGPLKTEEARRLTEEFFAADEAVRESCVERSGGNPLFLVQLLQNLTNSAPTTYQARYMASCRPDWTCWMPRVGMPFRLPLLLVSGFPSRPLLSCWARTVSTHRLCYVTP